MVKSHGLSTYTVLVQLSIFLQIFSHLDNLVDFLVLVQVGLVVVLLNLAVSAISRVVERLRVVGVICPLSVKQSVTVIVVEHIPILDEGALVHHRLVEALTTTEMGIAIQ